MPQETVNTVKSESDKMVPLDTSGDSMDIEIKEKEEEGKVVVEEKTAKPVVEEEKDKGKEKDKDTAEEEEYSQAVKKRIDKMTFKIREAERQKEEAIKFAESIKKERDELKGKVTKVDAGYIDEYQKRVSSELDKAQQVLEKAITNNDVKAQVEAQKAIARLSIEEERANATIKQRKEFEQARKDGKDTKTEQPLPLNKVKPDPKAEAWAGKNSWFGDNEAMTYTALSIHKKLISQEGFDGKSDEYYNELNKRMREEFPHKFEDKDKSSRVVQTVASANRSTKSGRRTVRLTPSQIAIAKKLGVPLEEYAKHVKEA